MKFHLTLLLVALPPVLTLLSGCREDEEIKVYRASKTPEESHAGHASGGKAGAMPDMGGMGTMGGMGGGGQMGSVQIVSSPPASWEAQPLSSIRQASYLVKGENGSRADISLITLVGAAGGTLDNVNRWLGQLGQPPISQDKLQEIGKRIPVPMGELVVVDLEGLPPGGDAAADGRILGGILPQGEQTLFFKMRGNVALVEAQKAAFIQWIGTVRMQEAAPATSAAPAERPAADPHAPKWKVPPGWTAVTASSMRVASFQVAGGDSQSLDVSVSFLEGDGGGDLQNVNRWRGQVGLELIGEGELKNLAQPLKAKDAAFLWVDMPGPKARVLAGWTKVDGKTWFFKLTGPDMLAGSQKENFVNFLQSVQFHP